ncbi:VCBS domain-containing protein [Polynucleobacter kasalickyi]|uniref:VCBS repeat-containing protein n=1 Tax=Polynucleobacter kasalickyi TaxID=1938817 RepID=A0A1W2AJW8_9BURK|nr:VCBS domain-containing protein [Polynucleobacter kasalickyi]SMC61039.1 VCBS repeat-containing protein [Polynucleobacter kasalickyi]
MALVNVVNAIKAYNANPLAVVPLSISDTATNIAANLDTLNTMASNGKIASVVFSTTPTLLSITALQFNNDNKIIALLPSNYTLNIANVLTANVATLFSNTHVTTITVSDNATNIAANLPSLISNITKISSITETGTITPISLNAAQYSSSLTAKFSNFTATITGALVANAASIASDKKVASISVLDTSANIAKGLDTLQANIAKITSITQSGTVTALAITATQLTSDATTLAKIAGTYTLSVTNVLAANVTTTIGNTHVTSITVVDSATNITTGLSNIISNSAMITSITETGKVTPISLTAAQYSSNLTAKFTNFTAKVSGVAAADAASVASDAKVASILVVDTSANIAKGLDTLQANIAKITSITQSGTVTALAITATQLTNDAATLAKIAGSYTLVVTNVFAANVSTTISNTHVTSITVADSATNITTNLSNLIRNLAKITAITETGTITPISLTTAQYSSSLTAKFSNFTASVSGVLAANVISITADTKVGAVTITDSATNITTNLSNLISNLAKITTITETGTIAAISLTAAQYSNALTSKFSNFTATVSGVLSANAATVLTDAKVASISVTDTATNLANNLNALQTAGVKLTAITQSDTGPLTITSAQLTADAVTLAKINAGVYTLNVTNVTAATTTTISANTHVVSLAVTDTATNIALAANLAALINAGSKLTAITETGTIANIALTSSQYSAALTAKFTNFTATLSAVTATFAGVASADAKVSEITISDTAAGIAANFDALHNNGTKITAITQTDANPLTISASQITNNADVLAKLGTYTLVVANCLAADATSLVGNSHVTSISISDTGPNIAAKLDALHANLNKITAITQTDANPLTITVAQLTSNADVLAKLGAYNLVVTKVLAADVAGLLSNTHIKSISISDTAANIAAKLDALHTNATKITAIEQTDDNALEIGESQLINDADVLAKLVNTTGKVIEAGGVNNSITETPTVTGHLNVANSNNTFTAISTPTAASYGSYTIDDSGHWTYTLDNSNSTVQALNVGQSTTDTFTVSSIDGIQKNITITINGTNDAAFIEGVSMGEVVEAGGLFNAIPNTPTVTGTLLVSDWDSAKTFNVISTPAQTNYGTYTIDATGHWTYTLNNNRVDIQTLNVGDSTTDTFTVYTADGTSQEVTITINGANDAAFIEGVSMGEVVEAGGLFNAIPNTPTVTGTLLVSDWDSAKTFNVISTPAQTNYGTYTIDATGHWSYTLNNNRVDIQTLNVGDSTTDTFTVYTAEGTSQEVTITIVGTNDNPIITSTVQSGTVKEDEVLTATGQVTSADVDHNATATYSIDNNIGTYGSLALDSKTGQWTYTFDNAHHQDLAQDESHTEIFTVTVTDDQGATTKQDVAITVNGTNDAPVITSGTQNGIVGGGGTNNTGGQINVTQSDHGSTATFSVDHTHGTYGSVGIDSRTGQWTYTLSDNEEDHALSEGESRDEIYVVTVNDGKGGSTSQTITVTIVGTNDAPIVTSKVQIAEVKEDSDLTASGQVTSYDVDHGATATYSVNHNVGTYGSLVIDSQSGKWTYTLDNANHQDLAQSESHDETFTVIVTDDKGATAQQDVIITVKGTNDAPVITSTTQAGEVKEDTSLTATGQVSSADVDHGATATYTGAAIGTYGSFEIDAATGVWTYTLDNANHHDLVQDESHTETFTVTVTDDKGATAKQNVTITVKGTNNTTVIDGTSTGTVIEAGGVDNVITGIPTVTGTLTSNINHATNNFTAITNPTASSYGTYTMDANGLWTYTLDNTNSTVQALNVDQSTTDTFTVQASDGTQKNITITINGTNDAAVISGTSTGTVVEAGGIANAITGTQIVTGTLTASDVDNVNTFQVVSTGTVSDFAYGSYNVDASGNWTYTIDDSNSAVQALNDGQSLNDTFSVLSADGTIKKVTITINGSNDSLVIYGVLAADAVSVASNPQVVSMLIADSSSNVATYLDSLESVNSKITSITLSDHNPITVSVAQLTTDHDVITKITNLSTITVSDTADHLSAAIDQLEAMGSQLGSVVIADHKPLTITSHQLTADASVLSKIAGGGLSAQDITNPLTQIFDAENGHIYQLIQTQDLDPNNLNNGYVSWTQARTLALNSTINGVHGYLVNITSAAENIELGKLFAQLPQTVNSGGYWIGASRMPSNNAAWEWVDGPEAGQVFSNTGFRSSTPVSDAYTNWYLPWLDNWAGDVPGGAPYGKIASPGSYDWSSPIGLLWDDAPNLCGGITGYIVEYSTADSAYKLNITDVLAANASSVASNSHVVSMLIADSSANISTNLDSLEAINSKITSITLSDQNPITVSVAQLTTDHDVIAKITNSSAITVSDTADHLSAAIDQLEAMGSQLGSVVITDQKSLTITAHQLTADSHVLEKIVNVGSTNGNNSKTLITELNLDSTVYSGYRDGLYVLGLNSITLAPGKYVVDYLQKGELGAIYSGWGPWGDPGNNYYSSEYNIEINGNYVARWSGNTFIYGLDNTSVSGKAHPYTFSLTTETTVDFFISDNFYVDNGGGISIAVNKLTDTSYTLIITDVLAVDATSVTSNSHVVSMLIADSSANISTNLDSLEAINSKITSITLSDNSPINLSVSQLTHDADVIAKITNISSITVSDSANHIAAGINQLAAMGSKLGSIVITDHQALTITSHQLTADAAVLNKIVGGVDNQALQIHAYVDGRSHLIISNNTLQWENLEYGAVGKYGVDVPTVISVVQNGVLVSSYNWMPTWTGLEANFRGHGFSDVLDLATLPYVEDATNINLTVQHARCTVAVFEEPSVSNGWKSVIEFNDPAGGADWYDVSLKGYSYSYNLNITDVLAADASTIATNPHVTSMLIADSSANISTNLDSLEAINSKITSITLTDVVPLTVSVAQLTDDHDVIAKITNPSTITVSDTASNISNSLDIIQADVSVDKLITSIVLIDNKTITLSYPQLTNDSGALALIHGNYGIAVSNVKVVDALTILSNNSHITSVALLDTAANIASHLDVLQLNLSSLASINVTDPTSLVHISQATYTADQGVYNLLSQSGYQFVVDGVIPTPALTDNISIAQLEAITDFTNISSVTIQDNSANVHNAAAISALQALGNKLTHLTLIDFTGWGNGTFGGSSSSSFLAQVSNLGPNSVTVNNFVISFTNGTNAYSLASNSQIDKVVLTNSPTDGSFNWPDYSIYDSAIMHKIYDNDGTTLASTKVNNVDTLDHLIALLANDTSVYGASLTSSNANTSYTTYDKMVKYHVANLNGGDASANLIVLNAPSTVFDNNFVANTASVTTYQLLDTAANIASHLDVLHQNISSVVSITVSDSNLINLSLTKFASDHDVIAKITNHGSIVISDTAANIASQLDYLEQNLTSISSITVTDPSNLVTISSSQFVADHTVLQLIANYKFAAYSPSPATYQPSNIAVEPITLQGNAAVANWVVTSTATINGVSTSSNITFHQDSTGANITFGPMVDQIIAGTTYTISAKGLDSQGINVATGNLSFTPGYFATLNNGGLNFNTSLSIHGVSLSDPEPSPSASADSVYFVTGNYSAADVSIALQTNTSLLSLANNGQLALSNIAFTADSLGYNPSLSTLQINGVTLSIINPPVDNSTPLAIYSPIDTDIQVHMVSSSGYSWVKDILHLKAGVAVNFPIDDFIGAISNTYSSLASSTQIYFTDSSGQAVNGLKLAHIPLSGGLLTSTNVIAVGSSLESAVTVYNGSVSQVLTSAQTAPVGSVFTIVDSINNIRAAGSALYNLEASGALIGAFLNNGFAPIPYSSTSGYTPVAISDGVGHTNYIDTIGWAGSQLGNSILPLNTGYTIGSNSSPIGHSVLALKTSSTQNVNVYIDYADSSHQFNTTKSNYLFSSYYLGSVNGVVGIALPSINSSSLLKNLSGYHTLLVSSGAGIGVAPPGGGFPNDFASSQSIWIGSAAELPTSLNDIHANTLYIVKDLPRNIQNLTLNHGDNASGVLNLLASKGLIAYSIASGPLNFYSMLETVTSNVPMSNVDVTVIVDTAYHAEEALSSSYSLGFGNFVIIRDSIGRLLSPGLASIAATQAAAVTPSTNLTSYGAGLNSAFNAYNLSGTNGVSRVDWSDSLASLTSTGNQNAMAAIYTSHYQLDMVQISDTVSNYQQLSSSAVSGLIDFVKNHSQSKLGIAIRDTVDNLYSTFGNSSSADTFKVLLNSTLGSTLTGVSSTNGLIEIFDTVANIEAANITGKIQALMATTNMLSGVGANNNVPIIRLHDTVANINAFLENQQDSTLWPLVSYLAVQDTAANIASEIVNLAKVNNWQSAIALANNIWVEDSFANVQSYASSLFSGDYVASLQRYSMSLSGGGYEVNKVIFTDISGATSPLIAGTGTKYSTHGQLPIFDFSQARGFVGNVTASESAIAGGAELTISDQYGHQVVIDIMTALDPNKTDLYSVVLPAANLSIEQLRSISNLSAYASFSITDTSSHIASYLNNIQVDLNSSIKITAITVTDPSNFISISTSQFSNDSATLKLFTNGKVAISDSSDHILSSLNLLKPAIQIGQISAIHLTDLTRPIISLTAQQFINDQDVLLLMAQGQSSTNPAFSVQLADGETLTASQALTINPILYKNFVVNSLVVSDSAANIQLYASQLQSLTVDLPSKILLSDSANTNINLSVSQSNLIDTIQAHIGYSVALNVSGVGVDQASLIASKANVASIEISDLTINVIANLASLETLSSKISKIDLTDNITLNLSEAQINDGPHVIQKLPHQHFSVSPQVSSTYLLSHLTYFEDLAKAGVLNSISLTDSGTPVLAITKDQFVTDSAVFGLIGTPHQYAVSGVLAANVSSLLTNNLITQVGVSDTAAHIQTYWAQLESLNNAGHLANIVVSDGNLLTVSDSSQQSYDLLSHVTTSGPINLYINWVLDWRLQAIANENYSFNNLTLVTNGDIYGPNGGVSFDTLNTLLNAHSSWSITNSRWVVQSPFSSLLDFVNHITNSQLLNALGGNGFYEMNGGSFVVEAPTIEQFENYYKTPFYKHLQFELAGTLTDTTANFQANLDLLAPLASHLGVMPIVLSDVLPPQINVSATQVVSDVEVLNHINSSYLLSVHDTAANLNGLDLSHVKNPYIEFAPTTLGDIVENTKVTALDLTHVAGLSSTATITEHAINGGAGTEVDITNGGQTYTISLTNTALADLAVYQPVNPSTTHDWDGRSGREHYFLQDNQSGDISDTHFDRIFNWGGRDLIEYANNHLTVTGNSGSELAGLAHIDLSTGNLVFSSQDNTLQKQISAAEAAIAYSNDPTSGHFAKWENGGNTYVLITDGHTSSGVGHGDNLVELVGVTSSHAQLVNGTITYG